MTQNTHKTSLYLITPPVIPDVNAFARELEGALDAGDVAALQIRLKDLSDYDLIAITKVIAPIAQDRGVAVLMNDRVQLVKSLKLDGAHIGQSDMPLKEARALLGKEAMIGVTCHNSRDLAMDAAENGADYVAFGAFYPTTTKAVEHMADLETLSIWQESIETPCVAIGGITAENAGEVAAAGADFIAVSGAVWNHPQGAAAGVKALITAISAT